MRRDFFGLLLLSFTACSAGERAGFDTASSSSSSSSSSGGASSSGSLGSADSGAPSSGSNEPELSTIIYANSDDSLYELDPATNKLTLVGKFSGAQRGVTDCAVNASGEVYVNTSDTLYKASMPSGGTGTIKLTEVASLGGGGPAPAFYALAFAPAGVLGKDEGLVGGDNDGGLWAINPKTGDTHSLGSFGKDKSGATFALSGDLVFYLDSLGTPRGLATIRSCSGGTSCNNDYLAAVDMTALSAAFTSGTPATKLIAGIYGASGSSKGPGIGHGSVFGLGAWGGKVFGFKRASANNNVPAILAIDSTTGVGKVIPGSLSFTNGWSGACVSTKAAITIAGPN